MWPLVSGHSRSLQSGFRRSLLPSLSCKSLQSRIFMTLDKSGKLDQPEFSAASLWCCKIEKIPGLWIKAIVSFTFWAAKSRVGIFWRKTLMEKAMISQLKKIYSAVSKAWFYPKLQWLFFSVDLVRPLPCVFRVTKLYIFNFCLKINGDEPSDLLFFRAWNVRPEYF